MKKKPPVPLALVLSRKKLIRRGRRSRAGLSPSCTPVIMLARRRNPAQP